MTLPTVSVEFGFGQSIGTSRGSITWTDVTAYVRADDGVTFSRGRSAVGQAPSAQTLSVTLANGDGRFTPGRAGGPYGTGVRPRIPVRIRATSGSTYGLWYGFVTDVEWNPGGEVRAQLMASDILGQAGKIRCRPWLTGRHLAQAPTFYWPLTDAAGATTAKAAAGGRDLAVVNAGGSLVFGVESDASPDGAGEPVAALTPAAPEYQKHTSLRASLGGTGAVPLRSYVISAYIRPVQALGYPLTIASLDTRVGAQTAPAFLVAYSDGVIQVYETWYSAPGGTALRTFGWDAGSNGTIAPNQWHHVLVVFDVTEDIWSDRIRVWVDGAAVAGVTYLPDEKAEAAEGIVLTAGAPGTVDVDYGGFDGQLAHVALWASFSASLVGPPVADPAALAAYLSARDWAPAAARFTALDDVTPQPAAIASWVTADSSADIPVSAQPTAGRTLLEVAQDVATAERGNVIATRDGYLHLQSSRSRLTTTVALTLDARTDVLSFEGAFAVDDADGVDEAVVTRRPAGDTYTGKRAGGVSLESTSLDVWTTSAVHAQAVADGVANYPDGVPKSPRLTVSMSRMDRAGFLPAVLGLELGALVRVTNLPASAPSSTVDLVVESIAHSIASTDWVVTLDTSPGALAAGAAVGTSGALSTVASTLTIRP